MGERYGETESRVMSRDCDAVSVPWGRPETLPEGSYAMVTQRLGGSITVMCGGNLYRIAERDADALGLEPQIEEAPAVHADGEISVESVEQAAWKSLAPATTRKSRSTSSIWAWSMPAPPSRWLMAAITWRYA